MTAFLNPQFLLTALLVSAVIFVNGWTDAPNAVATCIASTTHTKTTAVLGVGIAQRQVNFKTYGSMLAAWILTFPACFAIGYFSVTLCV